MPLPTPESLALAFLARPRRACGRGYFHCSANTAARPPARGPRKQGEGGYPGDIHAKRAQRTDRQTDRRARGKQRSGSFVRTPLQRRHCRRHARLSRTRREGKAAQNRGGPWGIALTRCLLAVPNARRTNLGANGSVGDTQRCAAACEQVRSPEHWDYGGRTVLPNGTRLPITYARTSTCTRVPPQLSS